MPSTDFSDFHFVRPWWLLLLIALAALLWWLRHGKNAASRWDSFCEPHLLAVLLTAKAIAKKSHFFYMAAFTGMVAILSLAGPVWEKLPQPTFVERSSLIIGLDLSRSMTAADLDPNRLARARFKIADLLEKEKGNRQIALIVFAGEAYTLVPFTEDTAIFDLYIQSLDSQMMPVAGSRPDLFLREAADLLERSEVKNSDLLLISDFSDERAVEQAARLSMQGHRLSVLAVGTEQGAPIRSSSGGFMLDEQGEVVLTVLAEPSLRMLAQRGMGLYHRLDLLGSEDVEALHRLFAEPVNRAEAEQIEKTAAQWHERGPWLLFLILPFAMLCFRRGILLVLPGCMFFYWLLASVQPAWALDAEGLWLNPDQRGAKALQQGDAESAADLFEDKRWKAMAHYRAGDYEKALEAMGEAEHAEDWYNHGNILMYKGDYEKAIESYTRALGMNEGLEDAMHNRKLAVQIVEMIKKQQMAQAQKGEKDEDGQEGQKAQQAQKGEDQQPSDRPQRDDQDESMNEEDERLADERTEESEADESSGHDEDPASQDEAETDPIETMSEEDQLLEQKLRHVPGNPRDFLRRKLDYLSRSHDSPGQDKSDAPDRPEDRAW